MAKAPSGFTKDRPSRPSATESLSVPSWHVEVETLASRVREQGTGILDGYTLNYAEFARLAPEIVRAGLVSQLDVDYVLRGIREGFDLGVNESALQGKRVHRNYKSAYEKSDLVSDALRKRVARGKTIKLGEFHGDPGQLPGDAGIVVPNGSVAKKLEPDAVRPFSDHTKTGFNAACDMTEVAHTLDTYNEISAELKPGYFMRVEDIDGAFPILPLHPKVWKYMYVWWFDVDRPLRDQPRPNTLYMHVFADFGTGPLPGIWDKFFRVCKAMAKVAGALTLPMPHFVDDNSLIGPDEGEVNEVAERVGRYLDRLGVPFIQAPQVPGGCLEAASPRLLVGFGHTDSHPRGVQGEALSRLHARHPKPEGRHAPGAPSPQRTRPEGRDDHAAGRHGVPSERPRHDVGPPPPVAPEATHTGSQARLAAVGGRARGEPGQRVLLLRRLRLGAGGIHRRVQGAAVCRRRFLLGGRHL